MKTLAVSLLVVTAAIAVAEIFSPIASAGSFTFSNRPAEVRAVHRGVCRHVVDGDSLYLDGVKAQIRLWGVDAPERDEAGYEEARQNLRRLAIKQELRCEQLDLDKYQRIVARCFRNSDQRELNRAQIALPSVSEYCRYSHNYYNQCPKR